MSYQLTKMAISVEEDRQEFVLTQEQVDGIVSLYERWSDLPGAKDDSVFKNLFNGTMIYLSEDPDEFVLVYERLEELYAMFGWEYDEKYDLSYTDKFNLLPGRNLRIKH